MAIVEVTIIPLGVPGSSLSHYVARVIRTLEETPLHYELTPMGTIISGDLDAIWAVLRRMHESCFSDEVPRVLTQIRIDDRRDCAATPERKVQSVLQKLGKEC